MEFIYDYADAHHEPGECRKKILSSSEGVARAQFIREGLNFEIGSLKETLAIRSHRRNEEIRYINSIVMVQSIRYAADRIVAALTPGASAPSPDSLNKALDLLQDYMMPDEADKRVDKAAKIKKILEDESNSKPFTVVPMAFEGRQKGRGLN